MIYLDFFFKKYMFEFCFESIRIYPSIHYLSSSRYLSLYLIDITTCNLSLNLNFNLYFMSFWSKSRTRFKSKLIQSHLMESNLIPSNLYIYKCNYHDGGWADCRDATAGEDVILQLCDVELPRFFHLAGGRQDLPSNKAGCWRSLDSCRAWNAPPGDLLQLELSLQLRPFWCVQSVECGTSIFQHNINFL